MRESTAWYLFLLAGLVIFVLLSIHMAIMHLDSILLAMGMGYENVLKFESVFARGKQVFFMVMYILLLGAALYHGLYGLRTILFELNLKKGLQRVITVVFLLAGIGLFVFGAYAAIAAYQMKMI
jgi:succinate dehydrogenase / fumarate reductase membrane anchor subunit